MVNIMVVEDEKPISNLIALSLKKAGYHSECAYDGLEAIDMLEKNYPDLILLDIMLPGADGFEILEYVKPLEIPVIFLTAKGDLNDRVNGLRYGAEDYIVKPFEIMELLARIEVVLRRYHKLDRIINILGLEIDTDAMCVKKEGKEHAPDFYTGYVDDDTLVTKLDRAGVKFQSEIPDTIGQLFFEMFVTVILPLLLMVWLFTYMTVSYIHLTLPTIYSV